MKSLKISIYETLKHCQEWTHLDIRDELAAAGKLDEELEDAYQDWVIYGCGASERIIAEALVEVIRTHDGEFELVLDDEPYFETINKGE